MQSWGGCQVHGQQQSLLAVTVTGVSPIGITLSNIVTEAALILLLLLLDCHQPKRTDFSLAQMGSTRVRIPPKGKLVFSCLVEKRERKMEMISQHMVPRWRLYTHTDLFGGLPSASAKSRELQGSKDDWRQRSATWSHGSFTSLRDQAKECWLEQHLATKQEQITGDAGRFSE